MSIKISAVSIKNWSLSVLTGIFMIPLLPSQTSAQLNQGLQLSLKFPPVEDLGAPSRTSGAGSRSPACRNFNFNAEATTTTNQPKIPLTALTPENNILTTVALDPKIYVYVPQAIDKEAEFRLVDIETEEIVYQATFPLVNTPGVVKVSIPKTANLQASENYQWQLLVICNPKDREADKLVEGWLKLVNLTPAQKMKINQLKANPLEQARLYSEYGIWHETVIILDQLRKRNLQAQKEWMELLTSVKLEKLAKIPVSDCCQLSASASISEN